jgi:glutamyl/glutaminyl-tRNA synthetase
VTPDPIRRALASIPAGPRTRFAPAPTGLLHRGHLVNAALVWGIARARGGTVVLRIEDHDRQRSRAGYEAALLEDLEQLGLLPDEPSLAALRAGPSGYRQSDTPPRDATAAAELRARGLAYPCDCARSTFAAWAAAHGRPWTGPGCPGACADRDVPETPERTLRVALGDGEEAWTDLLLGDRRGRPAAAGDLAIRDREGNWTYPFCVVVDDLAHGIDLVIRGSDLTEATPAQLRLARLLTGRAHPARFLHHPLVCRPDGSKLSKAEGATAVREALTAGADPGVLLAEALRAAGVDDVPEQVTADGLGPFLAGG